MRTGQAKSIEKAAVLLIRKQVPRRRSAALAVPFHAFFHAAAFALAWVICFAFEGRQTKDQSPATAPAEDRPLSLLSLFPHANPEPEHRRSAILTLLWSTASFPSDLSRTGPGRSTPVDETTRPRHATSAPPSAF